MSNESLETALTEQKQRLLAALEAEQTVDATPIVRDGETETCAEYVTLVYEFHHVILPALADDGLVEFERDSDTVRRGPQFAEKRPVSTDRTER